MALEKEQGEHISTQEDALGRLHVKAVSVLLADKYCLRTQLGSRGAIERKVAQELAPLTHMTEKPGQQFGWERDQEGFAYTKDIFETLCSNAELLDMHRDFAAKPRREISFILQSQTQELGWTQEQTDTLISYAQQDGHGIEYQEPTLGAPILHVSQDVLRKMGELGMVGSNIVGCMNTFFINGKPFRYMIVQQSRKDNETYTRESARKVLLHEVSHFLLGPRRLHIYIDEILSRITAGQNILAAAPQALWYQGEYDIQNKKWNYSTPEDLLPAIQKSRALIWLALEVSKKNGISQEMLISALLQKYSSDEFTHVSDVVSRLLPKDLVIDRDILDMFVQNYFPGNRLTSALRAICNKRNIKIDSSVDTNSYVSNFFYRNLRPFSVLDILQIKRAVKRIVEETQIPIYNKRKFYEDFVTLCWQGFMGHPNHPREAQQALVKLALSDHSFIQRKLRIGWYDRKRDDLYAPKAFILDIIDLDNLAGETDGYRQFRLKLLNASKWMRSSALHHLREIINAEFSGTRRSQEDPKIRALVQIFEKLRSCPEPGV